MSRKLDKQLACRKCKSIIPWADCNLPGMVDCRSCRQSHRVDVFPALFTPPAKGQSAEAVLSDDDASCFFHEQKKADSVCDACGRFLCKLCSIDLADMMTCSGCLETGRKSGAKAELMSRSSRPDMVSFLWSVIAAIFAVIVTLIAILADGDEAFYLLIVWAALGAVSACVGFYYWVRYRNKPLSVLPVSRWRFRASLITVSVSMVVIVGWSILTGMEL